MTKAWSSMTTAPLFSHQIQVLTQSIGRPPRDWEFLQEAVRMGTQGAMGGMGSSHGKQEVCLLFVVHGFLGGQSVGYRKSSSRVCESLAPFFSECIVYSVNQVQTPGRKCLFGVHLSSFIFFKILG